MKQRRSRVEQGTETGVSVCTHRFRARASRITPVNGILPRSPWDLVYTSTVQADIRLRYAVRKLASVDSLVNLAAKHAFTHLKNESEKSKLVYQALPPPLFHLRSRREVAGPADQYSVYILVLVHADRRPEPT